MIYNNLIERKSSEYQRFVYIYNEKTNYLNLLTKLRTNLLKAIIILCFFLLFTQNIIILFPQKEINLENGRIKYEKQDSLNLTLKNKFTTIKPIVLYNPKNYLINETSIHENNNIMKKLENQIKFSKIYGIYGFGFYLYWPSNRQIFNKPIDILIENKNFNINFLLIWKNEEREIYHDYKINQFFYDIKKYIIDGRYMKIDNKLVLGISNHNINESDINILRHLFKENELGELFILSNANQESLDNILKKNIFDGIYYSTKYDSLPKINLDWNKSNAYFYTHLLYVNKHLKLPNNKKIYRTSEAMTKYPLYLDKSKSFLYGDYSPEKFYFFNKIIIEWTLDNHNKENRYIFINNFNDLEPNYFFGYANINYFFKALYGLPVILNENFNLIKLKNSSLILVQIHVYYIDILDSAINKTNNIPVPFDLYITTNDTLKKNCIEDYLKLNSKANRYEILITPNKGRDVIPFLIQLKDIIKNYKYLCHIHTKKSLTKPKLGDYWRLYLYENLLGSKNIISQILSDFENKKILGLIFPEHFYLIIKYIYRKKQSNIRHLNNLLNLLFPKMKSKIKFAVNFPAGNMFWARTSAIYQIFDEKIIQNSPSEEGQNDGIILHGIERAWPFIAKLNGFNYKTILYYI
jgi:hypothetical protein